MSSSSLWNARFPSESTTRISPGGEVSLRIRLGGLAARDVDDDGVEIERECV
jgi:hypothetical protein